MSKISGGSFNPYDVRLWRAKADAEFGGKPKVRKILGGPTVRLPDGRTLTLPDFTPYVDKGAKLMDGSLPGWWRHIDTSALDLKNENMCVLGQTWQHYEKGAELTNARYESSNFRRFYRTLFGRSFTERDDDTRKNSAAHGFNITGEDARKVNYQLDWRDTAEGWQAMWEQLTNTWLEKIRSLQEGVLTEEGAARLYDEAIVAGKSHAQALLAVASAGVPV